MKHLLIIILSLSTLASCSSKKGIEAAETLPKDISQKPQDHFTQEEEQVQMKNLIKEIDSIIGAENCSDATDWKIVLRRWIGNLQQLGRRHVVDQVLILLTPQN